MDAARKYVPLKEFDEVLRILNDISILGGLSDEQVRTVAGKLLCAEYKKNELIFHQGDTASEIYVIESGRVKIVVDYDKEPLEIVEYGVGQCFGEASAIGILPHSASAVAVTDVRLLILTNRALYEISKEDSVLFGQLVLNIAREVCRRLHNSNETILHYAEAKGRK